MSMDFELLDTNLDVTLAEVLMAPSKHGELMPSLQCLEQIARKIPRVEIKNIVAFALKNTRPH